MDDINDDINNDISYFDWRCEELHIDRKYLHFLAPGRLKFVFFAVQNKKKKDICYDINIASFVPYKMTPSRFESFLRKVRSELFSLNIYADIFGVSESIQPASLEDLKKIVTKYTEELKNDK